jgi:hypothetical protein
LLRRSGDATRPYIYYNSGDLIGLTNAAKALLHAMRIGQSHRDIAILLVGALSRWVNHLEDEEMEEPKTKVRVK